MVSEALEAVEVSAVLSDAATALVLDDAVVDSETVVSGAFVVEDGVEDGSTDFELPSVVSYSLVDVSIEEEADDELVCPTVVSFGFVVVSC